MVLVGLKISICQCVLITVCYTPVVTMTHTSKRIMTTCVIIYIVIFYNICIILKLDVHHQLDNLDESYLLHFNHLIIMGSNPVTYTKSRYS